MLGFSYLTMTMNASRIHHYKDDSFFSVVKHCEGSVDAEDLCGWQVGCSTEPLLKLG